MELNREQIIKALECCVEAKTHGDCIRLNCPALINGECIYIGITDEDCYRQQFADVLSLIKELTEDNERLRAKNAKYEAENHAQFDKWLKLEEATKQRHHELFEEAKIVVKADTVRKMQTEIEARCIKGGIYPAFVKSTIDKIAKEMLEGDNNG